MIDKKAIREFLNRKLDNFDFLKLEKRCDLEKEFSDTLAPATIKALWVHQLICLILITTLRRFMLFIDMGGGKTATCLIAILWRKLRGEKPRAIVFVPYVTSVKTWIDETKKHTPSLKCVPLVSDTATNLRVLTESEGDLFVVCYQSALAMLAGIEKTGKKGAWKAPAATVREVFADFDMLIMDEIHRCKNVNSLTFRMCRAISGQCKYSIGLTGTPFGRDLQALWPQFFLIDFGETLGPTLGFFRSVFYEEKKGHWTKFVYKFNKKMMRDLKRIIKHCSIRYSIDELHDLPPYKFIPRNIEESATSAEYVALAAQRLKQAVRGHKTEEDRQEARASYNQLRQLSSGFMTVDGSDSTKIHIEFQDNPKLDVLQELIEDMPHGCKMVVFHHFIYTNTVISKRLKKMGIKHARVYSKTKDPIGELDRFQNDPKCTVLVINSRSGSSSLNLQNANYVVFFEQPDSAIDRQQAERRTWRPGQTKRVFYFDLFVNGTVDKRMFKMNKVGKNLLKELLDKREIIN